MTAGEKRTVGERGQVTIPKSLRERFGIRGGDEVVVREEAGTVVIEPSVSRAELAEGYRQAAQRARELTEELEGTSADADATLGDAPTW